MKYLVLLLIVLGVIAWFRIRRDATSSASRGKPDTQDMLPCTRCGVHLPRADAVQGRQGVYCCDDHRQQQEG